MRSTPDRRWSTTTKIHPINHQTNILDHPFEDKLVNREDQPGNQSSDGVNATIRSSIANPCGIDGRRKVNPDWQVDGYSQLVTDRVRDGWTCHLVTILFSQLPGPQKVLMHQMADEVLRIYNTLLTWVHRKPNGMATDDLMLLVGAFDLPVHKRNRSSAPIVMCNGGLHFHALVLLPTWSRLTGSLAEHFAAKSDMYAGPSKSVSVHVEPKTYNHGYLIDYVFKTVLRGRLSYDDAVLVLPRARSELASNW